MASCEFPPELGKVSGTLSKRTYRTHDGIITKRVVAQVRNGKQHLYIRIDKPRRAKPNAAELQARSAFGTIASEVARRMREGDTRPRSVIWKEVAASLLHQ
jgi:hypothetical protein